MSEIYILNVDQVYQEDSYEDLLGIIPLQRREKIDSFRFKEDKKRALYASVLIRYILYTKYGQNPMSVLEEYNSYGKPYIKDIKNCHYNLSHSGEWVICGFSNCPIGVDIEKIGKGNLSIAKRFFSEKEYSHLISLQGEQRKKAFYDIWTLKESYVKYIGKGLSIPLDSFSFSFVQDDIIIETDDLKQLYFANWDMGNDYIMSVCTEEMDKPKLITVSQEDILQLC